MFTMRITGGPALAKALRSLPDKVSVTTQRRALRIGGDLIRERASEIAPRAPGAPDIADHIGMSAARSLDDREVAIKVGPTKGFQYGIPLELGTRYAAAQPFMRPAFDEMSPSALKAILSYLWERLTKLGSFPRETE